MSRGFFQSQQHIWGAVSAGILLVFFGCSTFFCFKRKLYACFRLPNQKGTLKAEQLMLKLFQLEQLQKATNNFSQDSLVGSGAFGNVYRGTFDREETLAIKKAHAESYISIEEFENEIRLLSKVKHRNLVSLVGFCQEAGLKGAKILVYEFVPNGSLLDYIMGRGGRSLTWRQRVTIAIGAAKGIAHLHEGIKPSIIHRDIKPSNILVGENFEAKVSDFGLVKSGPSGDQSHVSSQIKGTPGYLDPAYCSSLHLTSFTDVYSYGVILLQLVAARPVVEKSRGHPNFHIIDWARPSLERGTIDEIIDANLLMEQCNMEMMFKMGQLGLKCVAKVPKERPTMTQVWQELEAALFSAENIIFKQPSNGSLKLASLSSGSMGSRNHQRKQLDYSQSSVSIDGIRLQRFHMDIDRLSFGSANLRCLDAYSISIEDDSFDLTGTSEETTMSGNEELRLTYDIS
ncbi:probable serine/threonine-protein kinase PBL11 [Nicotiana tomentosiformis]|uniref:probable serine/threonine-protein kinase PBL11 n=1 Tax=Nicotiana tomentosiformis TaxID=4098 RepID=UPI00051B4FFE|nr:probable serine/threonine-protein kinase PBL9 isoform X1 [Nicotiana tomentosiformis]